MIFFFSLFRCAHTIIFGARILYETAIYTVVLVSALIQFSECDGVNGEGGAFFLHTALNCKHSTPGYRISNNHQLCFCWLTCDNLCGKFKSRPKQWGTKKKRENNWTTRAEECVVWKIKCLADATAKEKSTVKMTME